MSNEKNDRKFPLILAGYDYNDFINKYHIITDKLEELQKQYQQNDPDFDISIMWTCYCINGQTEFNITDFCCEPGLKSKMLEIFKEVLG